MKKVYLTLNEVTRQELMALIDTGAELKITVEEIKTDEKKRTLLQNSAMHKDFANVAKICNDNNITAASLYSIPKEDAPVTAQLVKEFWHHVLSTMGMEPKTSKLTTEEVSQIREGIERAFAMRRGVDIGDFPSLESMSNKSLTY